MKAKSLLFNPWFVALVLFCVVSSMNACHSDSIASEYKFENPISFNLYGERVLYKFPREIDIDGDGSAEYNLGINVHGGDKGLYITFFAEGIGENMLMGSGEGQLLAFNTGDRIKFEDAKWSLEETFLCERRLENGVESWYGDWKDGNARYLPLKFSKGSSVRLGWLLMSVDDVSNELVLHELVIGPENAEELTVGEF